MNYDMINLVSRSMALHVKEVTQWPYE